MICLGFFLDIVLLVTEKYNTCCEIVSSFLISFILIKIFTIKDSKVFSWHCNVKITQTFITKRPDCFEHIETKVS